MAKVKLGETRLLCDLRAVHDCKARHLSPNRLNTLLFAGLIWGGPPHTTPEGEALLAAAELWDALPEADEGNIYQRGALWEVYDLQHCSARPQDAMDQAMQLLAAALEAKRRNEEADHAD